GFGKNRAPSGESVTEFSSSKIFSPRPIPSGCHGLSVFVDGPVTNVFAGSAAAERLKELLGYVEEVIKLDERPVFRLNEYRLPTGQAFVFHQHEFHALPGITHNLTDEDGRKRCLNSRGGEKLFGGAPWMRMGLFLIHSKVSARTFPSSGYTHSRRGYRRT